MAKKMTIIDLDELELTNNDLFVRKSCSDLDKNAQVIVEDTHCAILIKDGQLINTLSGGRHPIFDKKDKDVARVDIIYMSKTARLKVLWGTLNKLNLRDPITELGIEVGANGEFEVQIKDPRKFYMELVGADKSFTLDNLKERTQGKLLSIIEPIIAKIMREDNLSYIDLAENKAKISVKALPEISKVFEREYGLMLFSFIISKVFISQECIEAIETELAKKRAEEKEEKTVKEYAAELERLDDKQWERELILRDLQAKDYDKYLEVCKVMGWEAGKAKGTGFCNKCGHSYQNTDKFCPGCGNKVGEGANVCPKCKKNNEAGAAFCSGCGTKL